MKEKIKTLQVIHLSLCASVLVAYLILGNFTMVQLQGKAIDTNDLLYLILPFAAFFISNFLFKYQLKLVDADASLEDKLSAYQTASVIRWAVLEGAAFVILIIKPDLVIFGILLFVYLIFLRPTEMKFINSFQ